MSFPFKIARGFLFLSALYVGLVTPSTLFPFIVGKYAWFRGTVDLALIAFAFGLLLYDENGAVWARLKATFRKPLTIAVSAFTVIFLLAGFFGVDPAMSFWSNFERGEGGLQILHLFVFFVLLVTLFREEKDWRKFFVWSLVGGLFMVFYGVGAGLRYVDAELSVRHLPEGGVEEIFTGKGGPWYQTFRSYIGPSFSIENYRFQGSIGNAAYVAAYAIFMLFYVAYLFTTKYRDRLRSFDVIVLISLFAVFLMTFFLAATRGAFLGLLAGLVVGAGYYVFAHRAWRKRFAIGAVALALIVGTMVFFRDSPFVRAIPGSRIFDLSLSAETFRHRAIMWGMAIEGWKERPLLGWGPENYIQIFDRKMDPAYFKPAEGFGAWFDRAHSVYFDYLAETGTLGFLAFLALFVVLFKTLAHRGGKEKHADKHPHQSASSAVTRGENHGAPRVVPKALVMGAITAYLVQGIVLFDVLPIYYNLFVVLAFSAFFFEKERGALPSPRRSPWGPAAVAAPLALLGVVGIIFGVYAPVARARAYISALQTVSSVKSIQGFRAHFDPVLTHWSPIGGEEVVKYLGGDIAGFIAQGSQPEEVARALVAYIEPHLFRNNVRHLLMGGRFYEMLWRGYGGKEDDFVKAERYYLEARAIGPTLPPVLYALYDLYSAAGQEEKRGEVRETIVRLWPEESTRLP